MTRRSPPIDKPIIDIADSSRYQSIKNKSCELLIAESIAVDLSIGIDYCEVYIK